MLNFFKPIAESVQLGVKQRGEKAKRSEPKAAFIQALLGKDGLLSNAGFLNKEDLSHRRETG
ncbi:hypothetical protein LO82_10025 [Vibrio vulnificus]|nr:hypothetical protein LO82_10025 [Vibrio vulnificus]